MYRKETISLGETSISFIVKTNTDSETWIPCDESNSDYQAYLAQQEAQSTPNI